MANWVSRLEVSHGFGVGVERIGRRLSLVGRCIRFGKRSVVCDVACSFGSHNTIVPFRAWACDFESRHDYLIPTCCGHSARRQPTAKKAAPAERGLFVGSNRFRYAAAKRMILVRRRIEKPIPAKQEIIIAEVCTYRSAAGLDRRRLDMDVN